MSNQQVATQQQRGQMTVAQERKEAMDAFKAQLRANFVTIFQPLLPAHMTPTKFEAMVVSAVLSNPDLLFADRGSLMTAVADTADLGLSLNKQMREADILLVGGKAQLRPRYEGVVKLAQQSGEIIDVYAHEVYENDDFSYELGLNKDIHHVPAEGDRGPLTQEAYCVWTTRTGVKGFEVIKPERIDRARKASKSYQAWVGDNKKTSPWITDEAQMIRKTAIHAASHYMPKSTESDKFMRGLAMSTDTNFDEDHIGVPSSVPVLPPPPKPTRESTKAAVEAMRKEQVAQDQNFHQTMDEGDPRDKADKAPTPEPEEQKQEETRQEDQPQNPQFSGEELEAFAKMFLSKLAKVVSENTLNAGLKDYAPELEALESAYPKKHKEIMDAVSTKRASLKRR